MEVNEEVAVRSSMSPVTNAINSQICITVCPTTGGQFAISISPQESVENLRKKIGRHLQTPYERLNLLFKEKVLETGSISTYNIQEGSKVTLLPAVESGFSSTVQGTQQSIIQAIESLSDAQIDDFLSGRSPLTLALRVGDHMMFVQLQLEQSVNPPAPVTDSFARSSGSSRQHQLYEKVPRLSPHRHCSSPTPTSSHRSAARKTTTSPSLMDVLEQKGSASSAAALKRHAEQPFKPSPLEHLSTTCAGIEESCSGSEGSCSGSAPSKSAIKEATPSSAVSGVPYRRQSTTCGKITSGVGPLSSHGTASGSRVAKQMQRLRRLCGAHQQCVVYSNRELASEISSIVHAAKHMSDQGSSGASHRRSGKSSTRERNSSKATSSATSQPTAAAAASNRTSAPGASIDSVTSHGPGIFSGTFSGSLHPNIQDSDGRPKRDPQTILQILTDLLSATNHYEGQTGNIGMLPQLFKEQFNKQSVSGSDDQATLDQDKARSSSSQSRQGHGKAKKPASRTHCHPCPFDLPSPSSSSHLNLCRPYQQLFGCSKSSPFYRTSSVRHFPADLCRTSGDSYHPTDLCGKRGAPKCPHSCFVCPDPRNSPFPNSWSQYHSQRRSKRQAPIINVPRMQQLRQENWLTRHKMQALKEEMQLRRKRRQLRREACGPYHKRTDGLSDDAETGGQMGSSSSSLSTPVGSADNSLDMEIDDIQAYADDLKTEVTHESPETVTV